MCKGESASARREKNRPVDDLGPAAGSELWARSLGDNDEGYNEYRQPLLPPVIQWLGPAPDWVVVGVGAGTFDLSRLSQNQGSEKI